MRRRFLTLSLLQSHVEKQADPMLGMQLAFGDRTFVVDVIAISRDASALSSLSYLLRALMLSPAPKLGYAMGEDLRRMELAMPGCAAGAAALSWP